LDEYGDEFEAKMGAEGIRELLRGLDIAGEIRSVASRIGINQF
jgi:DNA-directed RNA polymerase subunit beta'